MRVRSAVTVIRWAPAHAVGMSNYRRVWVPGGTYFFTVNLLERRRRLLVEHIDLLRDAFRAAKAARPFHLLASVVLPDHLHCVWRLPRGRRRQRQPLGADQIRLQPCIATPRTPFTTADHPSRTGHLATTLLGAPCPG